MSSRTRQRRITTVSHSVALVRREFEQMQAEDMAADGRTLEQLEADCKSALVRLIEHTKKKNVV